MHDAFLKDLLKNKLKNVRISVSKRRLLGMHRSLLRAIEQLPPCLAPIIRDVFQIHAPRKKWQSASQVKPMPPWVWMFSLLANQ